MSISNKEILNKKNITISLRKFEVLNQDFQKNLQARIDFGVSLNRNFKEKGINSQDYYCRLDNFKEFLQIQLILKALKKGFKLQKIEVGNFANSYFFSKEN